MQITPILAYDALAKKYSLRPVNPSDAFMEEISRQSTHLACFKNNQ